MKNTLMLFLIIGLLVSTMSCGDKGETIDYIHRTDIHYVNEIGVTPIQLDFYRGQEMKISVIVNSNDTTFKATDTNAFVWMLPACHDSVSVKFGDMPSKTYRETEYVEGVKNPCRSECYEKADISETHHKYTFTFTKDMLE